jgi:hypothetical protein
MFFLFSTMSNGRHVSAFGLPISLRNQIKVPKNGWYVWDSDLDFPLWQFIASLVAYSVGVLESVFDHSLEASAQRFLNAGGKITSKWQSD